MAKYIGLSVLAATVTYIIAKRDRSEVRIKHIRKPRYLNCHFLKESFKNNSDDNERDKTLYDFIQWMDDNKEHEISKWFNSFKLDFYSSEDKKTMAEFQKFEYVFLSERLYILYWCIREKNIQQLEWLMLLDSYVCSKLNKDPIDLFKSRRMIKGNLTADTLGFYRKYIPQIITKEDCFKKLVLLSIFTQRCRKKLYAPNSRLMKKLEKEFNRTDYGIY